jgi:hypothetical protein
MSVDDSTSRTGAFTTLALSGVIGYYVGSRGFPEWQVPVETAQVIAGLVTYPPDNPFLIYHLKLWTILHQICALLLAGGMSEIRLSTILSGVTGMLSFQALAMTTYAFSRSTWLSTIAAIVVFVGRATDYGVRYPIFLLGTSHTYGSVGLSWTVLTAAMIGCGRYRAGLLLLGLAPAIHPSLGIWLGVIAGLSLVWDPRSVREDTRPVWRWFAAGATVTTISLIVHLWTGRGVPSIEASTASRYLATFTTLWDEHRQPMGFSNAGVALNAAAVLVGLLWLTAFKPFVPTGGRFLLRFVTVSGIVSFVCVGISHVPPERLPSFLVVLMPTRVVNVDAMMFAALLIGLVCAYRQTAAGGLLTVAVFAGLLLNHLGLLSAEFERTTWIAGEPRWLTLAVMLGGAAVLALYSVFTIRGGVAASAGPPSFRRLADAAVLGIVATALTPGLVRASPPSIGVALRDRTNDALLATAARGRGMLATGGDLHLVQLRTRRPVIIDGGGLDGLPYAVAGAPEMVRILRDIYGIDFFHPPDEARGIGMIPSSFNRRIWEAYSTDRWKEIRRAYNVTQVMTYNDWTLQLPIVAQNAHNLLYEIPE